MTRREFLIKMLGAATISSLLIAPSSLLHSKIYKDTTADIFTSIITKASKQRWCDMEMSDLVTRVALEFIDTPYVGGTLDKNPTQEIATINLSALDCVTLFENSLCIARCIKKENFRYADLINEITFTRYQSGKIVDYTSRLHYTSGWILDNIDKNVIEDVSEKLGGAPHKFSLNYMTNHYQQYPSLKKNPEFIKKISEIETYLSNQTFYVIAPKDISAASSGIQDGDIIAIATSQPGLDYSHIGIAFNKNLLHASSKAQKVIIDTSISKYVNSNKKSIGISVLRPKNPLS